jgi:hypothetical protein
MLVTEVALLFISIADLSVAPTLCLPKGREPFYNKELLSICKPHSQFVFIRVDSRLIYLRSSAQISGKKRKGDDIHHRLPTRS